MSQSYQADDASLMRIYKEALTHTLDAAVRAVYEKGLRDGIKVGSTIAVHVLSPAAETASVVSTPSVKPTGTR